VKSAPRLTETDIEAEDGISTDSIIFFLKKDIRGKVRPDTGFVTYGAVEYDGTGISEAEEHPEIYIFPSPVSTELRIIILLERSENILIDIIDMNGKLVDNIYTGITDDILFHQVFKVNHLSSATYFLRIQMGENVYYERFLKI
jgi:hypothetical protein